MRADARHDQFPDWPRRKVPGLHGEEAPLIRKMSFLLLDGPDGSPHLPAPQKARAEDGWTNFEWKADKIKFSLPGCFKEVENTGDHYVAKSGDGKFFFAILEWKDSGVNSKDALKAAIDGIKDIEDRGRAEFRRAQVRDHCEGMS